MKGGTGERCKCVVESSRAAAGFCSSGDDPLKGCGGEAPGTI